MVGWLAQPCKRLLCAVGIAAVGDQLCDFRVNEIAQFNGARGEHVFGRSKFSKQLAQRNVTETGNQDQTQPDPGFINIGRRHAEW